MGGAMRRWVPLPFASGWRSDVILHRRPISSVAMGTNARTHILSEREIAAPTDDPARHI